MFPIEDLITDDNFETYLSKMATFLSINWTRTNYGKKYDNPICWEANEIGCHTKIISYTYFNVLAYPDDEAQCTHPINVSTCGSRAYKRGITS